MKEKSNITNLIIIVAIIIVIALAGYFYATRDQSSEALLLSTNGIATSTVDNDLLTALRALKRLKLDNSIFSNPTWLSLTDFSQTIPPQSPGRPNPFSPLDASLAATSTSQ